jgi:hypothetical protein
MDYRIDFRKKSNPLISFIYLHLLALCVLWLILLDPCLTSYPAL